MSEARVQRRAVVIGAIWLHDFPQFVKDRYPELGIKLQPGWETRSRSSGGFEKIMGVCCHHDAGGASQSTQGRADYSCNAQYAPVGNFILGVGGLNDIILIAAGSSNTQGKGGPYNTSKGQVPLDDGNRRMIAIEAANTGTGSQDWNPAQQVAYLTLCAALIECYGLKSSDVISHSDWTNPVNGGRTNVMSGSKRKIDPGGGATPGRDWAEPKAVYKNMWRMDRFARDIDRLIADRNTPKPPPYTPYPPRPEAILGVDKDMQILANPSRIFDTRHEKAGAFKAGETRTISLPKDVQAPGVQVTITAVGPQGKGYVTVWASGAKPEASCLNFESANIANTTSVGTAGSKSFQLFASKATGIIVDVVAVQK